MTQITEETARQIYTAADDCSICANCWRKLEPMEPVWRRMFRFDCKRSRYWTIAPVCEHCSCEATLIPLSKIPDLVKVVTGDKEQIFDYDWVPKSCKNCGRPVSNEGDRSYGRHVFCCRNCARRFYSLSRKKAPESMECSECGKEFKPTRSDSVYCSNVCRQKSYRKRTKAKEEEQLWKEKF